jgi:hypothetical protein
VPSGLSEGSALRFKIGSIYHFYLSLFLFLFLFFSSKTLLALADGPVDSVGS